MSRTIKNKYTKSKAVNVLIAWAIERIKMSKEMCNKINMLKFIVYINKCCTFVTTKTANHAKLRQHIFRS